MKKSSPLLCGLKKEKRSTAFSTGKQNYYFLRNRSHTLYTLKLRPPQQQAEASTKLLLTYEKLIMVRVNLENITEAIWNTETKRKNVEKRSLGYVKAIYTHKEGVPLRAFSAARGNKLFLPKSLFPIDTGKILLSEVHRSLLFCF